MPLSVQAGLHHVSSLNLATGVVFILQHSVNSRDQSLPSPESVCHSVMSDACNSIDCSLPGSSIHGIFQARTLEWVAISFSRGSA